FLPAAVLLSLWSSYVINRTFGPVTTTDLWMPYALLFAFLLFSVTCVSVAIGEIRDLPIMVCCGGLLVHGHVSQLLFVAVLGGGALLVLYRNSFRSTSMSTVLKSNCGTLFASAALVVVLASPILIEMAVDHPNNPQKIQTYLAEHRGEHNRVFDAVKYEIT